MTTHFGVSGTRQEPTPKQVNRLMAIMAADLPDTAILHHGDCVGVDRASHYLAHAIGLRVVVHPPENSHFRAYCQHAFELREPEEYLRRDRRIICETSRLIALPHQLHEVKRGSGTWYTIRYACHSGKPVTIIWPTGTITNLRSKE